MASPNLIQGRLSRHLSSLANRRPPAITEAWQLARGGRKRDGKKKEEKSQKIIKKKIERNSML